MPLNIWVRLAFSIGMCASDVCLSNQGYVYALIMGGSNGHHFFDDS